MQYRAQEVEDRSEPIVVDQDGNFQPADYCAQLMNECIALKSALEAGIRWQLPDGPCWCDLERRRNWRTKIHSRFCKMARSILAERGGR